MELNMIILQMVPYIAPMRKSFNINPSEMILDFLESLD
jgi:hypothetical protein